MHVIFHIFTNFLEGKKKKAKWQGIQVVGSAGNCGRSHTNHRSNQQAIVKLYTIHKLLRKQQYTNLNINICDRRWSHSSTASCRQVILSQLLLHKMSGRNNRSRDRVTNAVHIQCKSRISIQGRDINEYVINKDHDRCKECLTLK